jgi:hypothetical protein
MSVNVRQKLLENFSLEELVRIESAVKAQLLLLAERVQEDRATEQDWNEFRLLRSSLEKMNPESRLLRLVEGLTRTQGVDFTYPDLEQAADKGKVVDDSKA